MQPRRPDSAKSRVTQKTLDTQLNRSKLSQTFTSYTTFHSQRKDEFLKYLEEKDKDPKFRKYQQTNLPQIPQNQPKQQLSKINSKPFDKRSSKIVSKQKIQQPKQSLKQSSNNLKPNLNISDSKWTINQSNMNKKESVQGYQQTKDEMNSQKSFAEKNREKMNSKNRVLKKSEGQDKKSQGEDRKKQRIVQLKGFKVNIPGKRKMNKQSVEEKQGINQFIQDRKRETTGDREFGVQTVKENVEKQDMSSGKQRKREKSSEQIKRQEQLLEISRFINQVQRKNMEYYPEGYEQFVQQNDSQQVSDLQKIDIDNFLVEPTEKDYRKIEKKIKQNEKRLHQQQHPSTNKQLSKSNLHSSSKSNLLSSSRLSSTTQQPSIDLDQMIDGESQRENDNQIFLSSISSKELKERNLFLTEVLKGRVTRDQINRLDEMEKSQLKIIKLQHTQKQPLDDDIEIVQINMMKKKSNRLLQRNLIQASGQIYRDCDYLSEQNKLRLQNLLNGPIQPSPFQLSEWQTFALRRIDQGIRLYRQLSNSSQSLQQPLIDQQCLPKDPILRKEAEKKILRQKINNINQRLQQIQNIVITQTKIQSLIQQFRTPNPSPFTQQLIQQRHQQMQQLQQRTKLASQMLTKAEQQKSLIQATLFQLQQQYRQYENQYKSYEKMTIQEIVQRQKQDLKEKKKLIQQIQHCLLDIESNTQTNMDSLCEEIKQQIQLLNQIENLNANNNLNFEPINENQTLQQLDALFSQKAKLNPQFIKQSQINTLSD